MSMEYIKGTNRQQIQMLSLEQMVHPQSFARIIDVFVDSLDLASFNFKYQETKPEDRTKKQTKLPFNPADLLKPALLPKIRVRLPNQPRSNVARKRANSTLQNHSRF